MIKEKIITYKYDVPLILSCDRYNWFNYSLVEGEDIDNYVQIYININVDLTINIDFVKVPYVKPTNLIELYYNNIKIIGNDIDVSLIRSEPSMKKFKDMMLLIRQI